MVAQSDGVIAGVAVVLFRATSRVARLYSLAVAPRHTGRGIASALLATMLRWAWERGSTHAYLQVDADNHPAIAVYRKYGFADAYTYHYRGRPGECH